MQTFTDGNLWAMSGKHRPASAEWDQDVTFCSLSVFPCVRWLVMSLVSGLPSRST